MRPSVSARNFTPTSIAAVSVVSAAFSGVAVEGQIVHGQPELEGAAVVKVHVLSAASGLPALSLTPLLPPRTVAV